MAGKVNNIVIIGAGCAGLTAAIYCARAELEPIVFAGSFEDKGGLLMKTSVVENYPGFPDGILGYDLMVNMEQQAVKYGTQIINSEVVSVDFSKRPFRLVDSDENIYYAKAVIVCTGSKPNKLGLENEKKFWANGISSCAVCDGALYKGKKIVVVGGGDSSMEEALFLTKFSNVTLIHRRDEFRASKIMQERVRSNPKIKILYNTVITKLIGSDRLEKIVCADTKTNKTFMMDVDGLFYGLGLTPNTELFKGILEMDNDGYIIKYRHPHGKYKTMTSVEGVFVAGDNTDKKYKQAVTACGEGCRAALDIEKYLQELD